MKFLIWLWMAAAVAHAGPARLVLADSWEIAKVPADFRVGFSLLTTPDRQYAAYYAADRSMTVSSRALNSDTWVHQTLDSKIGWDSHNYVTMAVDSAGHLHVSGNMHCVPLIYFRTTTPGDISTLEPASMTGELENRVTYPKFLTDHEGRLIFTYRHGGSGNGITLYNRYDPATRTWSRLFDTPLFDGEGARNAYPSGPIRSPDGWFHIHWVWRDTPCCSTNHHLSYIRSRDLIHWESAFGEKAELPIRIGHRQFLVDPIPSGGGIINGGHHMIFDAEGIPVIAYHKNDAQGNMQLYAARPEDGTWKIQQLTQWDQPIPFSGNGSMPFIGIGIHGFHEPVPGILSLGYRHKIEGSGTLHFDTRSFTPVKPVDSRLPDLPPELQHMEQDFPGLAIQRSGDLAGCGTSGVRYLLQWESLGASRDQKPAPPLPAPSTLRLHKLIEPTP